MTKIEDSEPLPSPDELPDPDEVLPDGPTPEEVRALEERRALLRASKPKSPKECVPPKEPWKAPPEPPTTLKPTLVAGGILYADDEMYGHSILLNIVDGKVVGIEVGDHEMRPLAVEHAEDAIGRINSNPPLPAWIPNGRKVGKW